MLKWVVLNFLLISIAHGAKLKEKLELKEKDYLYIWEESSNDARFLYSFRFILNHRNDLSIVPDPQLGYIQAGVDLTLCINSVYVAESYNYTNLGLTTLGCSYLLGWFK